jgi:hypothetical protein
LKKLMTAAFALAATPAWAHEGHDHHGMLASHDALLALAVLAALAIGAAYFRRK